MLLDESNDVAVRVVPDDQEALQVLKMPQDDERHPLRRTQRFCQFMMHTIADGLPERDRWRVSAVTGNYRSVDYRPAAGNRPTSGDGVCQRGCRVGDPVDRYVVLAGNRRSIGQA